MIQRSSSLTIKTLLRDLRIDDPNELPLDVPVVEHNGRLVVSGPDAEVYKQRRVVRRQDLDDCGGRPLVGRTGKRLLD